MSNDAVMEENKNKLAIRGQLKGLIACMEHFAQPERPNPMIGYYRLMLDKGTWFIGRKLAKDYEPTKIYKRSMRPKIKQCFYNSQMFCCFNDEAGAKYYEGYMCDSIVVVHHAWIVMSDGNVVDMTLEARDAHHKREGLTLDKTEPVAYLGVEVPLGFLKQKIVETQLCQPYAQCYYLNSDKYFIGD